MIFRVLKKLLPFSFSLVACAAAFADNGGYLFVTFKGEATPLTEQIYFALSKDGRTWNALNGGNPVLVSRIGERGVRDPFLLRSYDGKGFYLLATDLSINRNGDWGRSQAAGSKSIVIWESPDLTHWTNPRLVRVAAKDAGCTWAPEAVFDEEAQDYLVFWASKNRRDRFAKQRIWAARTKDFRSFGEPFIYIEKPNDVIDTDIVEENGKFYRFSKDEHTKAITMETSESLKGPWQDTPDFSLGQLRGYEGPECYRLKPAADGKPAVWCLVLDHYSAGAGYQPYVTEDLAGGQFTPGPDFSFPFHFRHGSIMPLSDEEFNRLDAAYGKSLSAK